MAEMLGRGKGIRTPGPCLPKTWDAAESRRNLRFGALCITERAQNSADSMPIFTGPTPEQHRRAK